MNNLLPYLLAMLQEYGYPILWLSIFLGALGIPLPNSLLLLAAGAFAALGNFNFALLFLVALSAFVTGDNCSYWIGRLWGSKVLAWLEGRLFKPSTVERSRVYFHRLGNWAIFLSRFLISILGGEINLLAGAELYPYRRFLIYDLAGEALGALIPLTLGYIFGASWDAVGGILGSFSIFFMALLVALFLGVQALRLWLRLRKVTRLKRAAEHEQPPGISVLEKSLDVASVMPEVANAPRPPTSSGNLPL